MNATSSNPLLPLPLAKRRPTRWTLPSLLAVVALFDVCFWGRPAFPGLALAIFFAAVALLVRLNRPRGALSRLACIELALLLGAVIEAVIETGFCNVLMLLLLASAFAAETYFTGRSPGLDRWSAQVRAFFLAPFRLAHLGIALPGGSGSGAGVAGRFAALMVIAAPTLALLLLFGALLSNANAVFSLWTEQAFLNLGALFPDIGFYRLVLWMVIATAAVAFLWPSDAANRSWNWTSRFGRWPGVFPAPLAFTASAVMLLALNAMFLVANFADAMFLWHGGALPAGVNYSQYVHEGVELLIVTVLLSALVLASLFNQPLEVAGRPRLKVLGGLWIAQNLFLLASTARRLDLYIKAYDASVYRFSVLIFLLLVAVGFALLAMMIFREKSPAWLVGKSLLASFATLYLAQFLNLGGWVADYNVARWEHDRTRDLDAEYLSGLGPTAWPAWTRADKMGAIKWGDDGRSPWPLTPVQQEERASRTRLDGGHWCEFSLRAWWNRAALEPKTDNK